MHGFHVWQRCDPDFTAVGLVPGA